MSDDVFAALRKLLVILIAGATLNLSGANLFAQPASGGSLRVTVVDQTGAVIVGATVTVAAADEATKAVAIIWAGDSRLWRPSSWLPRLPQTSSTASSCWS